jgi:RecB family endonuclease NucS
LAEDSDDSLVVIELKAGKAKDSALGQLLGYMGCLSAANTKIRGVLVASDFDSRVIFAARGLPTVKLVKYQLSFRLQEVQ